MKLAISLWSSPFNTSAVPKRAWNYNTAARAQNAGNGKIGSTAV